jgi:GGDEF domain-containing protein
MLIERVTHVVRTVDSIGRHQRADGFICLLPETLPDVAGRIGERLVRAVRALQGPTCLDGCTLTVAFGVAGLSAQTRSTAELLAEADARAVAMAGGMSRESVS